MRTAGYYLITRIYTRGTQEESSGYGVPAAPLALQSGIVGKHPAVGLDLTTAVSHDTVAAPTMGAVRRVAQFRRQQVCKPGRLVTALLADEHEHGLVDLILVDPTGHHRHEPLAQVLVEAHLHVGAAAHRDRGREGEDMAQAVPRGQAIQVEPEGVVTGYEARLQHLLEVSPARLLDGIEGVLQRVLEPVVHRLPVGVDELRQFTVRDEGVTGWQAVFLAVLHRVVAQVDVVGQHLLDLRLRGIGLPPVRLVLLRLPVSIFRFFHSIIHPRIPCIPSGLQSCRPFCRPRPCGNTR